VRLRIGRALQELDQAGVTSGFAAAQGHVENFFDRCPGRYAGETAVAKDRALQRELRGEAGAHLLLGARLAGLVIDDGVMAVAALLDAVGAGDQPEVAVLERDVDRTADLGMCARKRGAPLRVPTDEPSRDAQEARPPERPRLRIVGERDEMLLAESD